MMQLYRHATTILSASIVFAAMLIWVGFVKDVPFAQFGDVVLALGFPSVGIRSAVLLAHLMALVLSFGAVMFLDLYLLRYLLFQPLPAHAPEMAEFGSWLVGAGLIVLWLTGLTFLLQYWVHDPVKLENPTVWIKVIVVCCLTINVLAIHRFVLPLLKSKVGRRILEGETRGICQLILLVGSVSFASWLSAVVLGLTKELSFSASGPVLFSAYVALNVLVWAAFNALAILFSNRTVLAVSPLPALRSTDEILRL